LLELNFLFKELVELNEYINSLFTVYKNEESAEGIYEVSV